MIVETVDLLLVGLLCAAGGRKIAARPLGRRQVVSVDMSRASPAWLAREFHKLADEIESLEGSDAPEAPTDETGDVSRKESS